MYHAALKLLQQAKRLGSFFNNIYIYILFADRIVLSAVKMSPTNHSAPSSPDVTGYASSPFTKFQFNPTGGPMYILNPSTASSAISSPLDTAKFSCLSQTKVEPLFQHINYFGCREETNNNETCEINIKVVENNKENLSKSNGIYSDHLNGGIVKMNTSDSTTSTYTFETVPQNYTGPSEPGNQNDNDEDEDTPEEIRRKKEDEQYLGVGGFSEWRGEPTPDGWVRKMGYAERFMTGSADFGVMSTVYNLWFESKEVVEFDLIEKTCYLVTK